jgi:hypothetical protein
VEGSGAGLPDGPTFRGRNKKKTKEPTKPSGFQLLTRPAVSGLYAWYGYVPRAYFFPPFLRFSCQLVASITASSCKKYFMSGITYFPNAYLHTTTYTGACT